MIEGKCFRRLSPDYYAWLRHQMERARQQHDRGVIPHAHYETLRQRFNTVHDRAVALFGDEALLQTVRTFTPLTYAVPSVRQSSAINVLLRDATPERETPQDASSDPDVFAGLRVRDRSGCWQGWIVRSYPADTWFPHGWADTVTDDGQPGQADMRGLLDAHGAPLIPNPHYTAFEERAIALARDERPEDFADLAASMPIFSFSVPGDWRFTESPGFEAYLKVNDIRERAHAVGWSDAELFQTNGRFKFPCGQDYGLVCSVRHCTIGEVSAAWIELLPEQPGGSPLRFFRPKRSVQER